MLAVLYSMRTQIVGLSLHSVYSKVPYVFQVTYWVYKTLQPIRKTRGNPNDDLIQSKNNLQIENQWQDARRDFDTVLLKKGYFF